MHTNLLGKIFIASLGAWVVGRATNVKLRGTSNEIRAIAEALMASRRFQDELSKPGATIESVIEKLNIKNMSARQFETVLGIPWPL